jgi:rSAM/selenodomain-associated transferase 1
VLALFAKAPVTGQVKTRLCPPLRHEEAAELYRAMLLDILEQHSGASPELELWYTPSDARGWFEANAPPVYRLRAQEGAGLGPRMAALFRAHASRGAPVVLRGTDSPTLPCEHVEAAFAALSRADLVLGPDLDGGYNLIGLRAACDGLFELPFSTATVLDETLSRARTLGLRVELVPEHYDVDVAEDLERLARDANPRATPRTLRWLRARGLARPSRPGP